MKREYEIKNIICLKKDQEEICRYCHKRIKSKEECGLTYDSFTRLVYYHLNCLTLYVDYNFMEYSYYGFHMRIYITYRFFRPEGSK